MTEAGNQDGLTGGSAIATITPPLGTPLAGLFHYRAATAVEDDLTVRSLVLRQGATTLALVLCDLICLTGDQVTAARAQIERQTGIPGDHVMISCTHTHYGPATRDLLISEADQDYLAWVVDRIGECVTVAQSRLVPVTVASGATTVDGVCFNRRFLMNDGTVVFNPGLQNPNIVRPMDPVDPTVTGLLVEDVQGNPIALWANLSLHYVGTDDECTISPDYFGHFAQNVQRWLGRSCIGMLTNGASGDINNVDVSAAVGLTGTKRAKLVARAVAAAAIQATAMQQRDPAPTMRSYSIPFELTRRPILAADLEMADRILTTPEGDDLPEASFSYVRGQPIPLSQRRHYAAEVFHVARMPDTRLTSLQILQIDDLTLIGLPGEIFVELGLELKRRLPSSMTAVVSLANDYIGYVPTQTAFSQGGYETWAARSAWTAPGTGEAMVETVVKGHRSTAADFGRPS